MLSLAERDRLLKLLGMLGSSFDGERAAAGLKADEFLKQKKVSWADLIPVLPVAKPQSKPQPQPEPFYDESQWRASLYPEPPTAYEAERYPWMTTAQFILNHGRLSDWGRGFVTNIRHRRTKLTPRQRDKFDDIADTQGAPKEHPTS